MKKLLLSLLAFCLISPALTQSLIANYPFNGNANDATGKGNDGQIFGASPIVDRFDNDASAYFFDNVDDYIDLGNSSVFDLTTNFTVAGWFKGNFDGEFQSIISKGDFTWRIHRYFSDDVISFATTGVSNLELPGTKNVNDNEWHHFAATYDGVTKRLYIDGQLDAEIAATGSVDVNSFPVWIGANSERPDRTFNGSIDDIKIFNTALSASEVAELSNLVPLPADLSKPDFGNALNFGNATQSWVSIPADTLNELTDFTFETWFNYSGSTTYEDDVFALMGLGAGDKNQSMLIGRSRFEINYCPRPDCDSYTFDYTPSYQPGWNHFALVVDSSSTTAKVYVNGSLAAEANDIPYFLENYIDGDIAAFVLGRDYTTTNYYSGSLDEVRIWNYAQTEEEIQSQINFPINPQSNGLVYYFNFDEGVPGGNNLGINSLPELVANRDGELFGFTLTGNSSNWIARQELDDRSPRILSLSDNSSVPGKNVSINGKNFYSEQGFIKVFIGNSEVEVQNIENQSIEVVVPNNAFGTREIRVVNPFGTSRPFSFDVIRPDRGNFTFKRRPILTDYTAAFDLDIADFNEDGIKDIVVTSSNQSQKLQIILNKPNNGFLSGLYQQNSVAINDDASYTEQPTHNKVFAIDLNSDGKKDILTTTTSPISSIEWFDNATNWTPQVVDNTTGSIFPGDLDADGYVDIILLNINELAWYQNDGAGGFETKQVISSDRVAYDFYYISRSLLVTDVDNDNDADIVIGSNSNGLDGVTSPVGSQIFINDGLLNFTSTVIQNNIPASFGYNLAPQMADFNLDGNQDFLFGGLIAPVNLLQNAGSGSFSNTTPYNDNDAEYARRTGSISVGDFNGDGYPDFATTNGAANNESSTNFWWGENLQNPTTSYFDLHLIESSLFPTAAGNAIRVYNSDLDDDGDLDLLTISEFDNQISAYENVLTDNYFTAFRVEGQVSPADINTETTTINIIVSNSTVVDKLIPDFSKSERANVFLGGSKVVSGQLVTDFTNPVQYRIVSESADTSIWKVNVNKIPETPQITEVDDITQTSAEIEWSVTADTDTTILEISSDQFDTFETFELTGNEFIATLQPGLSYEVRVRSRNAFGLSADYSEIEEFSTIPATPTTPQISDIAQNTAVVNWSAIEGAEDYLIFVALDSTFTNYATGYNGRVLSNLEENIVNLQPGTEYWVRLRSRNESGLSPFSTAAKSTTIASSPQLIATDVKQIGLTLNWQLQKGANSYEIQLDGAAETLIVDGETTSFRFDTLSFGSQYAFRIRSVNSSGNSPWSADFVVTTIPGDPLIESTTEVSNTSAVVNWQAVGGATGYLIDISRDELFTNFVGGYQSRLINTTSESIIGLLPGTTYYLKLRAVNESGISGFSPVFEFITTPGLPDFRRSQITQSSIEVRWDEVVGSTGYEVLLVGNDTLTQTIIDASGLALFAELIPAKEYVLIGRSFNSSGASEYTEEIAVETISTTPTGINLSNVREESASVTWSESQGADSYLLQASEDDFTSFVSGYLNKAVFSNSENLTNLDAGEQYSVRISAVNSSGPSPFSETFRFYTLPDAPVSRDATSLTATSFTANWDDVDGSDIFYIVEIATDPAFQEIVGSDTVREGLSVNFEALESGVSHWYRIYAANPGGVSEPSPTISVKQELAIQNLTYKQEADRTAGEALDVSFKVTGGLNQYTITLRYKGITAQSFTESTLQQDNELYSFTFSPDELDDIGLEFEILVNDGEEQLTSVNNFIYWNNIVDEIPNLNLQDNWQMFSIPYLLEDDLIDAIFDEMAQFKYGRDWRLMHYNGNSNLDAGSGISRIEPGLGYWFYTSENVNIDIGDGSVNTSTPFQLDLRQGWNQIGNPYNVTLNWNSVLNANGVSSQVQLPVLYNPDANGYDETTTINPFEGAFVWSDQEVSVDISLVDNISTARTATFADSGDDIDAAHWRLELMLEAAEIMKSRAGLGMSPRAQAGKDSYDRMSLPRLSRFADIKTVHEEYFYPWFRTDILPTADEASWLFYIETSRDIDQVTLSWKQEAIKGKSHKLWLIDELNSRVIDMSVQNSIIITVTGSRMPISIHFTDDISKPTPYMLQVGEIYPNPSHSGNISFDLSIPEKKDNCHVVADLYNINGTLVKSLQSGTLSSGHHQITGKLDNPASGVYYLSITVDHDTQNSITKKLIIRKQ